MKPHLQCAEQQVSRSNLTKYCTGHAERLACLVLITYETSFTMRGATGVTVQPHQILRLSRRKTHLLNLQCAEQQVSRSNLTKYCACHAERLTYLVLITYETSFTVRGATGVTIQPHQILRLPRKIELQNFWQNLWKQMKRHFQCGADPTMIREWSDHDPRMKTQTATRLATEVTFRPHHEHFLLKNTTFRAQSYIQTFTKYCACHDKSHLNVTKYCACHEKWHLNFTKYCACHEKWHLNFTKYCTCHEKWHLNFTKYCTCHEKWLDCCIVLTYETSFTMRGATGVTIQPHQILRLSRRKTHILSPHHIWIRHLQCAEQQVSRSNLTKYCACHAKLNCKISDKIFENRWNVISNAGPIRPWSENDPTMIRAWSENENANRNPPRNRGYFSTSPRAFSIEKYNVSRPILHSNLHQILRLPRKVTLERHQVLRLPRKVTLELHQVLRLPRKMTFELHQILHLPRKMTLELHQILHLPRKMTRLLYSTWHYSTWLYSTWLYSTWPTLLDSTLLDTILLDSTLLDSTLLDSTLLDSTLLDSTLLDSTLLDSTLLDSTLLDTILLDSTLLDTILLDSTLLDTILLDSTLLDSTLLDLLYLTLLYLTLFYLTLLYLTLLYLTLLYLTLLYLTLLYLTLLYLTLLYLTLLYLTLFYLTLLYLTLFYLTLLYLTLFYLTLLYLTLLYLTYSTWLYSTWHYSTWLYSTWLYSTWLYSTWLYSTWLYSTWLNFTEMSFVYRKFLNLNFLWWYGYTYITLDGYIEYPCFLLCFVFYFLLPAVGAVLFSWLNCWIRFA